MNNQQITLTLSECDWLRIRAALLSASEDLAKVGSAQEQQYFKSYLKVKNALAEFFPIHQEPTK